MILTLIFMDESGDTGFKFGAGSSRYFVLVLVIFDLPTEAEKVSAAISALREELHLPADREFRFSVGSSARVKTEFLQTLLPFSFRYRALVVDKQEFVKKHPVQPGERLFEYVIAQLFGSGSRFQNATLFVDRISGGEFERKFNLYLRRLLRSGGAQPIRKIKHVESRRNNLLQVADMICGAVYRSYARRDDTFLRMIQIKAESINEWKE
jgi:Protein of unknown function (DUF3800)